MDSANENANPNRAITDRGWFCPACGGADVTASSLAGGKANCNICSWKGAVEELPTMLFEHDMGTPEEILRSFFLDVRKLLGSSFATQFGHLLIKWGFLDAPTPKNQSHVIRVLTRYMGAITKAVVQAVLRERQAIEREKHGEQPRPE